MSSIEWYAKLESDDEYWVESAKLDFAVALGNRMASVGMLKKDLAHKLQVSPARITRTLRGDANLTLETMVRLVRAVGGNLHVHIAPPHAKVRWLNVYDGGKQEKVNQGAKSWAHKQLESDREPIRIEA